jgi:hypothetical protein
VNGVCAEQVPLGSPCAMTTWNRDIACRAKTFNQRALSLMGSPGQGACSERSAVGMTGASLGLGCAAPSNF